ncbi:MAG: MFS transporter [Simkaniaceae bacterium]|nr:MFS transporter [Simkaniaceae bacterium]
MSWFVWLLAILFYFYEFFLRVLPGTVAKGIMQSMSITAEQFALIGSGYYITYSLMQIPVGLLLDKINARFLITAAAGLCAGGALWFSLANSFAPAFIGRLLIGLGSSFGFISLLIVTLNWFPRRHFALLAGIGQFLGAVGPLCAGTPIALLLSLVDGDWRKIFIYVAIFGIALTVLIGIFLQGKPENTDKVVFIDRHIPLRTRLSKLLANPHVWAILFFSALIYVALPILGAFWGVSYLEARGLSKAEAASIISMIWIGLACGSPLFGKLSESMKRRKPSIIFCALVGIISSTLFLYTPSTNPLFLALLFFFVGLGGSGQSLSFVLMSEEAPQNLKATALGLNNTVLMGFAALMPPIVTTIMQAFAVDGKLTTSAFEKGLLVLPIFFTIALLISIFGIRETFCRQQSVIHEIKPN